MSRLHLARTGSFTDMHGQQVELSADLLAQLAASYDPSRYPAPLVIGHPKVNSPAFGHLASLSVDDDGLWGEPINVDPAFAAAVRDSRYPNRSLSFWPADHPGNPVPGQPYLRHLGVLGAVPPAIPGLRGADLSANDDAVTVEFSAPIEMSILNMPDPNTPPVDFAAREAELAAREAGITSRAAELEQLANALAAKERAAAQAAIVSFCDGLANEARIRPGDIPALSELLLRLDADQPAPCFAASDSPQTPLAPGVWLRGWLSQLPPLVEMGSIANTDRAAQAQAPDLNPARIYATRREVK